MLLLPWHSVIWDPETVESAKDGLKSLKPWDKITFSPYEVSSQASVMTTQRCDEHSSFLRHPNMPRSLYPAVKFQVSLARVSSTPFGFHDRVCYNSLKPLIQGKKHWSHVIRTNKNWKNTLGALLSVTILWLRILHALTPQGSARKENGITYYLCNLVFGFT